MYGTPLERHIVGYGSLNPSGFMDVVGIYFPQPLFAVEQSWLDLTSALISFFSSPSGQNLTSQVILPRM